MGNYGLFLHNIRGEYDEAEKYYRLAVELNPNSALLLGNYAIFLERVRKNYNKAEEFYQRALSEDPNHKTYLLYTSHSPRDS